MKFKMDLMITYFVFCGFMFIHMLNLLRHYETELNEKTRQNTLRNLFPKQ